MGDIPHYFDIILFAMVAAFLILRLRSVLGRRTGNERRRDSYIRQAAPGPNIVSLPPRPAPQTAPPVVPTGSVASGLAQITAADPGFGAESFLAGARGAFELIVASFAAGDKARLRPLLSDDVYGPFAAAIDERVAANETLETRIVNLKHTEIAAAQMAGTTARVTVRLVSDQVYVLRAHDGSVVDGDPQTPIEKTDLWTFARDTRSADPNWVLVETGGT
jgi:predicted lipid-binding transport protein (Tim44 family)